MSTLMISDLSHSTELDRNEMSAVRGGFGFYAPSFYGSSSNFDVGTQQLVGQTQNVYNPNGNNVALACDISSKMKPVQTADNTNTVNVYGGGRMVS